MKQHARYIGLRTNNQAEYEALIAALEFSATLNPEEVICHLDSELVANQLTGKYRVKNPDLKRLWCKACNLARSFKRVNYVNVPRTHPHIQMADALVNEVLDRNVG